MEHSFVGSSRVAVALDVYSGRLSGQPRQSAQVASRVPRTNPNMYKG